MSGSYSSNRSNQASTTQDNRIAIGGSGIGLSGGSGITVGEGASIGITTSDPEVAMTAINLARDISSTAFAAAQGITRASNEIAGQVVNSQAEFVATASGQKNATIIVGLGLLAAAFLFTRRN